MLNKILVIAAATVMCTAAVSPATAATIIDNPLNGANGSCAFATTCGETVGALNPYAGQAFTLADTVTLRSASLTSYISNIEQPFSVNWKILSVGADGLPGLVMANGVSALTEQTYLGEQFGLSIIRSSFDVAATLGGGSYYLALQAVTSQLDVYLATADGAGGVYAPNGETWTSGYAGGSAVAVSLSGEASAAVPELSTWGMMIIGFGGAGAAIRRRRGTFNDRTRYVR